MYLPSLNDPQKWISAYECAHLGPNMKFVSEEKRNKTSYIMVYERSLLCMLATGLVRYKAV
jgi:hypothetical protein